jgi:hypothetical protein
VETDGLPVGIDRRAIRVTPFTIHHSPLTTHHSPLTTHHSQFTIHHSPLTTHNSPFNTLLSKNHLKIRHASLQYQPGQANFSSHIIVLTIT